MSQEDLCQGAMAAAASDADQPPDWLKAMLENQSKNNEQLRMMMTPILNHIVSSTQAIPTAPRWDTRESSLPTVKERRMPYSDSLFPSENIERSRNIASGPFAAELEVIQQRVRTSGPTRATSSIETGVRHRNSERGSQLLPPTHAVEQTHTIPQHQGQPIFQEGPRAKLAIFDGTGDWESFLVPFERQARKYGWSGAHRVDYLHECLRGAAIKYVCSLPEHIREDYTLLKEQLTQRFGQRDPPTTIRRKL